ncbi:Uncharacterised protein [Oligella ureolytica]|uniref:Uncharacterized protein n=1 Tax=Oligella ureolytica TaxID=90244 RepID=A0A378XEG1_9BURK|nr:hypothetical protein [Oligella ureolytica]SUA53571.1 Uncharacterised protein [Oligella ureolytica]SUA53687.1 Uncharacterised protein [Oligella ureolytica]
MRNLFILLLLVNVLIYGLGAGWLGFKPSELKMSSGSPRIVEYKPRDIHIEALP